MEHITEKRTGDIVATGSEITAAIPNHVSQLANWADAASGEDRHTIIAKIFDAIDRKAESLDLTSFNQVTDWLEVFNILQKNDIILLLDVPQDANIDISNLTPDPSNPEQLHSYGQRLLTAFRNYPVMKDNKQLAWACVRCFIVPMGWQLGFNTIGSILGLTPAAAALNFFVWLGTGVGAGVIMESLYTFVGYYMGLNPQEKSVFEATVESCLWGPMANMWAATAWQPLANYLLSGVAFTFFTGQSLLIGLGTTMVFTAILAAARAAVEALRCCGHEHYRRFEHDNVAQDNFFFPVLACATTDTGFVMASGNNWFNNFKDPRVISFWGQEGVGQIFKSSLAGGIWGTTALLFAKLGHTIDQKYFVSHSTESGDGVDFLLVPTTPGQDNVKITFSYLDETTSLITTSTKNLSSSTPNDQSEVSIPMDVTATTPTNLNDLFLSHPASKSESLIDDNNDEVVNFEGTDVHDIDGKMPESLWDKYSCTIS